MSLVGSLEDLGLGDILQIITLSRKSGALCLRSDSGEGNVFFRDGLVCGASVKGQSPDLRGLVVGEGALGEAEFEAACQDASTRGVNLSLALADRLTPERFEALRRQCVERAVLEMFGWDSGEFSFEVGQDPAGDEFSVVLEAGINAQYLAMEGTRRTDEGQREPEYDPDDVASFADIAEEIGDEPEALAVVEAAPADAYEAVALTSAQRVDRAAPRTEDAVEEAFAAAVLARNEPESADPATGDGAPLGERPAVIVLDRHLPLLEWVKGTLEGVFPRVHIFQQAELAVSRLRQYVARGEWPLMLVAPDLPIDGAHGWADVEELVLRMKKQSPRSRVLWFGERGEPGPADGELVRPLDPSSTSLEGNDPLAGESLKSALLEALGIVSATEPEAARDADDLGSVIARLSDPETRGEVLNVVLGFAARSFRRVALFAMRDGMAVGLAQIGLERAGGPGDDELRRVEVAVDESTWLTRLVESGASVRGPAEGAADTRLCAYLGEELPPEAWLGAVTSGEQVVAFLYGDNLPDVAPLPETEALEAALVAAGRALDAAVEERAAGAC